MAGRVLAKIRSLSLHHLAVSYPEYARASGRFTQVEDGDHFGSTPVYVLLSLHTPTIDIDSCQCQPALLSQAYGLSCILCCIIKGTETDTFVEG